MSIMLLVFGAGGFAVVTAFNERDATEIINRLERISRRAVLRSSALQETQVLEFTGSGIEYVGMPSLSFDLGDDGGILIQRAGSDRWEASKGYRWVFPPRGFCEPIAVRLNSGRTRAEMTFNPLTGAQATSTLDF